MILLITLLICSVPYFRIQDSRLAATFKLFTVFPVFKCDLLKNMNFGIIVTFSHELSMMMVMTTTTDQIATILCKV